MLLTKEKPATTGSLPLKDKVAMVTGAGSGIGRATALRLADLGAKICLVDLKENHSEKTKQEIMQAQGEAFVADSDVSDPIRVQQAVDETINQFGRLDIVFANAGINGKVAPIEDLTAQDWEHTLSTNLKSTFLTVKYAIPHMQENGGSVIITSWINGNRAFTSFGMRAYSTSKAGQMAFAKMAALKLAR